MKLLDLEPEFIQLTREGDDPNKWGFHKVETMAEADGILFLCPNHFKINQGPLGTHSIIVYFSGRNLPAELKPSPRWNASGEVLSYLTLSPSINLGEGDWHGHITRGLIV